MGADLKRLSFSHEALINWMIANPHRNLRDAAAYFGYTQAWLSSIIHSDLFQAKLAERQEAVFSAVAQDIPEKMRGAADIALEKLVDKLETTEDGKFILDAADKLLHRLGYAPASKAATPAPQLTQNNTFIVASSDLAAARQLQREAAQALPPMDVSDAQEVVVEQLPSPE